MLTLVKGDQPPKWCHRHLARGHFVPAARTRVPIEVDIVIIAPDLCAECLQDVDSWLRLFGLRYDEYDILGESCESCDIGR